MKKKWLLYGSVGFLFLIVLISLFIYFNNRIVLDNEGFTLKKDLTVNVYSDVKISDLIKSISGEIVENKKVNTEKLGKQSLEFIYRNEKEKLRKGTFEVEVKDKEEPLIWLNSSLRVPRGSEFDFEEEILCADNYDESPDCRVEGEYDLNTVGSYPLKYIAKDKYQNEESLDFTLHVYEPKRTIGGNTQNTQSQTFSGTKFSDIYAKHKHNDTEIGIDVSKWQGEIDFKKVKEAGASFVMIRVGSQMGIKGEYVLDPYFKQNITKALEENLKVGVYFYSYADSNQEAEKQAKWVLNQIKDYELSLPVVFDWECFNVFNQMELSLFGLNKVAETFLETIKKKDYDVMLYGSKNYLDAIWKYHDYNVWLAHYTEQTNYESDYVMWQLCQDGQIDGINGAVDINVLYK